MRRFWQEKCQKSYYSNDHFESHVYRSEDYGDHWTRVASSLPKEPVNVVKEDPINENIIYIGTDNGLYVSLDQGDNVMFLGDVPYAPVHDLVVHPRDKEIIVATHGRSLYKADVSHLQQLTKDSQDTFTCFNEVVETNFSSRYGTRSASWMDYYEPSVAFPVFTPTAGEGQLQVYADSLLIYKAPLPLKRGLSYYNYNLEVNESAVQTINEQLKQEDPETEALVKKSENGKYYLVPGKYKIEITLGNHQSTLSLKVKSRSQS